MERIMFSKVPSGCVRLTDAVEYGPALSVDVPRDQWRMNVVDQDRYQGRIVIGIYQLAGS